MSGQTSQTYSIYRVFKFAVLLVCILCVIKYLHLVVSTGALPQSLSLTNKQENIRTLKKTLKLDVRWSPLKIDTEYIDYEIKGRMGKPNNARVSNGTCVTEGSREGEKDNSIVLISNFIAYFQSRYMKTMYILNRNPTEDEMEARISEIMSTLDSNLNNENVKSVRVFVDQNETITYLRHTPFERSEKLVIILTQHIDLKGMLLYASECLQDNIVAITNQDNKLGDGWDKISRKTLKENKLLYALTRHPSRRLCLNTVSAAYCDRAFRFAIGCHDTFVLYMNRRFTPLDLKQISDFQQNNDGMENMFINMFRTKLGYTVINPCFTLKVHHEHCIPLRDGGRKRVNGGVGDGSAKFTDNLNP